MKRKAMSDSSDSFSNMDVIHLDRVCRICLSEGEEMKPLFDSGNENRDSSRPEISLNEILICSTQLQVTENDGLPCQICMDCEWKLTSLYKFKKKCEKNDAKLRKYIANVDAKTNKKNGVIRDVKAEDTNQTPISNGESLDFNNVKNSIKLEENDQNCSHNVLNNDHIKIRIRLSEKSTQTDLQNNKVIVETECKWNSHNSSDNYWDQKSDFELNESTKVTHHNMDKHSNKILDGNSKDDGLEKIKIEDDLQSDFKDVPRQVDVSFAMDELLDADTVSELFCSDIQEEIDFKSNVINLKNEPLDELLDVAERENRLLDGVVVNNLADVLLGVDNGELDSPPDGFNSDDSDYILDVLRRKRKHTRLGKKNVKHKVKLQGASSNGKISCDICHKSFITARGLKLHTTNSHYDNSDGFACDICGKKLSRMTHLLRHKLLHETAGKKYMCDLCPKIFNRKYNLMKHTWQHAENKPHACNKCGKTFAHLQLLESHMLYMHSEKKRSSKTAACSICQREFSEKYLETHMRMHTGDTSFSCTVCNKTFNSKWHLKEHNKWHSTDKPFLCSECGLRFIRNDYLVIHMRRHKGEKPYKCTYCGKGFPRATDLTVHERYHTGEKTHLCTVCGKGFQRQYNLKVHLRVHTGEKPYVCSHCGKKFAQGNDLKSHVRRHTGERYNCEVCGQGFIQGYHLTQHKRSMHGIECGSHIKRVEKYPVTTSPKNKKSLHRRPRIKPHPIPELQPLKESVNEDIKSSHSEADISEVVINGVDIKEVDIQL